MEEVNQFCKNFNDYIGNKSGINRRISRIAKMFFKKSVVNRY